MTTYPYYRQIKESQTIIRIVGRRHDGTLIADALFGQDKKGWWRLVPLTLRKIIADSTKLTDFTDIYPQEFLPTHR